VEKSGKKRRKRGKKQEKEIYKKLSTTYPIMIQSGRKTKLLSSPHMAGVFSAKITR
jgi:hypothetical protein